MGFDIRLAPRSWIPGLVPARKTGFGRISLDSTVQHLIAHEEREQTRPLAQNPGGFAQGPRLGSDDAGGLERPDAAGAERMDLLGHLSQTSNDAQPPNPARGRGAPGRQTPPLLLARLSASPTQRKEMVGETSGLTTPQ